MIPKIIHYCWFGKKEKPDDVKRYIRTWHEILPDYRIIEWNESNFDIKQYRYCTEAYFLKKYAFVSDVARLYALFRYGGVYLDTDVEVIKTFDGFLGTQSFIGYETDELLGTGVIGAEKECPWIGNLLDIYKEREFIKKDGTIDLLPNTMLITDFFKRTPNAELPQIYPYDVFCACNWVTKEKTITSSTVSVHHYIASWKKYSPKYDRFENRISKYLKCRNHHLVMRFLKWWIKINS